MNLITIKGKIKSALALTESVVAALPSDEVSDKVKGFMIDAEISLTMADEFIDELRPEDKNG